MDDLERPASSDSEVVEALGDTVLQSQTLESLVSAVNYNNWLTSLAMPYLGDAPIELGSGLGDYAQAWLDEGVPQIRTTEIDPSRLAHLRSLCRRLAGGGRNARHHEPP